MTTANEAEKKNARELMFAEMEAARAMLAALRDMTAQLRAHVKMDVKKHYSLMVADAAAGKAIHQAEAAGIKAGKPQPVQQDDGSDDEAFIQAARNEYASDDIEIDDHNVKVSRSEDGAFVAAWVWVSNEEAGLETAEG